MEPADGLNLARELRTCRSFGARHVRQRDGPSGVAPIVDIPAAWVALRPLAHNQAADRLARALPLTSPTALDSCS
jgi:hypothetical protein